MIPGKSALRAIETEESRHASDGWRWLPTTIGITGRGVDFSEANARIVARARSGECRG
jgi:hypothetical protein